MPRIVDSLPALYDALLPALLKEPAPVETKATCAHCAMVQGNAESIESVDGVTRFFSADTKCCTYHPRLPNYLVGGLLSDTRDSVAEGRRRMEERIARRLAIGPLWVRPTARYELLYTSAPRAFGKAASMRCPFHDDGNCTIWPYREAVCSTYFCKYVTGEDGKKFWMSLKQYLGLVEMQLSRWAALQVYPEYVLDGKDRTETKSQPITAEDLDEKPPPEKAHKAVWGPWAGKEAEYYRACFEKVSALSTEDVARIGGLDGEIDLKLLEKALAGATRPSLPTFLAFNSAATVKWLPDGTVALGSYSENDAVALPGAAYQLLVELDGKAPVAHVRKRWRNEKGTDLDDDTLRILFHHRVLCEA